MALVKLTEITIFEDCVFEHGDVCLNISEQTLISARKPKDQFGKPYTQMSFSNGENYIVRESPGEIAMKLKGSALPAMLASLKGHEQRPPIEQVRKAPEPKTAQEVANLAEFGEEMGTNVRRL